MQTAQQYKVAINCLVYNHEPYLRDCLEGFVMQQTDFPFVAIVHDDASTDHSADIIREYAAKYPDIIHPIYETENQWRKADGSLRKIMNAAVEATGAPYIAMCEGDDYWTDPHKLQKQVDFLDAHPEYTLCFHKVNNLILSTNTLECENTRDVLDTTSLKDLVVYGNYINTCSVVYRHIPEVDTKRKLLGSVCPGDYPLWVLVAEKGLIYKFQHSMAVYRVGSGIWSTEQNLVKLKLSEHAMRNRLRMVVDDPAIKGLIDEGCLYDANCITGMYENMQQQLRSTRTSFSFRLGKMMLKPFLVFSSLFLKRE